MEKVDDRKNGFRKVIHILKQVLVLYLIYLLVFGVCIYYLYPSTPKEYRDGISTQQFRSDMVAEERAVLIDGRFESYLARINMIESAKESIDLACYTIQDGWTSRTILGALIEAADRGVKVRILFDGMFNQTKDELQDVIYLCNTHENMEWKYYEMIAPLKPWTINNRLHDKFILVDGKQFILGGRNMGNKYYAENHPEEHQVRDRDVIILGQKNSKPVGDLEEYYESLWTSKAAEWPVEKVTEEQKLKGEDKRKQLLNEFHKKESKGLFKGMEQYQRRSVPVNKVSIVSNPQGHVNKYPLIFETLASFAGESSDIRVQSPYVVPSYKMRHYAKKHNIDYSKVKLYTNSEYSSPNPMGMAGYLIDRNRIVKKGVNILEYQKPGSIHGKSFIFDGRISAVGSFNLECRSSFLSTETVVIIDSLDFAEELQSAFDDIESKSFEVEKNGEYKEDQRKVNPVPIRKNIVLRVLSVLSYPVRILI